MCMARISLCLTGKYNQLSLQKHVIQINILFVVDMHFKANDVNLFSVIPARIKLRKRRKALAFRSAAFLHLLLSGGGQLSRLLCYIRRPAFGST